MIMRKETNRKPQSQKNASKKPESMIERQSRQSGQHR